MNNIILTGNLTQDINAPTNNRQLYGKTSNGNSFYGNGIAVNDGYYSKDTNQWVDRTYFVNFRAYGALADRLATQFFKGDGVLIQGKLVVEPYETQDGKKGTNTYVAVDKVERSSSANPHKQATNQGAVQPQGVAPQVAQPVPQAVTPQGVAPVTAMPQGTPQGVMPQGIPQAPAEDFNPFEGPLPFA